MSESGLFAPSRPLYELANVAPTLEQGLDASEASYPIANDSSASAYREASVRKKHRAHQQAENRVAIVFGEGALYESLSEIEEDTVVLVDSQDAMCEYFSSFYIPSLRQAKDIREHKKQILAPYAKSADDVSYHQKVMRSREQTWDSYGTNIADRFARAQELARDKAIIPWQANLRSYHDMHKLGAAITNLGGTVTFLNLTNIRTYLKQFRSIDDLIDPIKQLPLAQFAPILVSSTSAYDLNPDMAKIEPFLVQPTGPFYGIDQLREAGTRDISLAHPLGRLAVRVDR